MRNKSESNNLLLTFLVLLCMLGPACEIKPPGGSSSEPGRPATATPPEAPAPARGSTPGTLSFLTGPESTFSLEKARGKPLLLAVLGAGTFGLTGAVELANAVARDPETRDVRVVGILHAVAPGEDPRALAQSLGAEFPIARGDTNFLNSIGNIRALPSFALIGPDGAVARLWPGLPSRAEVLEALRASGSR